MTPRPSIAPGNPPSEDIDDPMGRPVLMERLGAWAELPFFRDDYPEIAKALAAEPRAIFPPAPLRFAALERTRPEAARVVILGQDPYPTRGHANGLAFSVTPDTALPRSLRNIYRELEDDIGQAPSTGDLTPWADQGVLLLNTALTVPEGEASGHARLGWSRLTEQVLTRLDDRPRAFLLWGRHAQKLGTGLSAHHLKIETAHPSPLSASRGFFGTRPFSRVNDWLAGIGEAPIRWA